MVDALNRLDQTDALVEQILGDRVKAGVPCQSWSCTSNNHTQAYPMELKLSRQPNETTIITKNIVGHGG